MSAIRVFGMLAVGALAAVLATATTAGEAHAQSAPQPPSSCRGTLSLARTTVVSGAELAYAASGLEPNAPYSIVIGGQLVARATTSNAGTTGGTVLVPDVLGSASAPMQVSTASTCAAGTVTIVGPRFIGCPFVSTAFGCGVIPAPVVVNPFFSTPVVTVPTIVPVHTCVPLLVGNTVLCR